VSDKKDPKSLDWILPIGMGTHDDNRQGARKPVSAYSSFKLYGIVLPIADLCDVALGNSERN